MTGLSRTSEDLDPRRKRILFRAWHRGMREMDLLMGRFVESRIATMSENELTETEALIDVLDRDLLAWLTGETPVEARYDTSVFRAIKAFHTHSQPLDL
jgi:antitoxin CptB